MKTYDVFLSYRRADGAVLASALNDYLRARGLRVFFDLNEMECGQSFPHQLAEGVRVAPHYILIATPGAFAYGGDPAAGRVDYVREEMRLACAEYEKDPDQRTLNVLNAPSQPYIEAQDLPADIRALGYSTWLPAVPGGNNDEVFARVFESVTKVNRRNLWYAAERWYENSRAPGSRFASLHIEKTILPSASPGKNEDFELPITVFLDKETLEKSAFDSEPAFSASVSPGETPAEKDGNSGGKYKKSAAGQPLFTAIGGTKENAYLIGEGGIGKTTALMHIMDGAYKEKTYAPDEQIPIFIELSFAPDSKYGEIYNNGESTFIRRSVYRLLREDLTHRQVSEKNLDELRSVFSLPYETAVSPINGVLSKSSPAPEYLLLLDGMNEVSTVTLNDPAHEIDGRSVYAMVADEIGWLAENCPNVQLVLTSRSDEAAIRVGEFNRYYLSGVSDRNLRKYLEAAGFSETRINAVFQDRELTETLRIPLFLTMYAALKETGATARGEIMRVFFHERLRSLDIYTLQNRLAQVEKDVLSTSNRSLAPRYTAAMYSFVLRFLLPELAWRMEREGKFYLCEEDAEDILEPFFAPIYDEERFDRSHVCGRFGKRCFCEIAEASGGYDDIAEIAEAISQTEKSFPKVVKRLLRECAFGLGILQKTRGEYGFVHQHVRDYFAAVKNVNTLRLSVFLFEKNEPEPARACMDAVFKERPVSLSVRRFTGEYLGEHKNKPFFADGGWNYAVPEEPCDRNLMKRALALYRWRMDTELRDGYALYSLLQILKEVRRDLSGGAFTGLDLTGISLNGALLSRPGLAALFDDARINVETLLPKGHTDSVRTACFSPDGKTVLTSSSDGTAKLWDAATCREIGTLTGHMYLVNSACFSPDGKTVVTASGKIAKLWDAATCRERGTLTGHADNVNSACFSPDGKTVLTASDDRTAKLWDAATCRELGTLTGHIWTVNSACFSPDGKMVVTASDDHTAKLWDAATCRERGTLTGHTDYVHSACFSPDGKTVVTASQDYTAKLWDAATCREIGTLTGHTGGVNSACFSPDGKTVVTASRDDTAKLWDAATCRELGTLTGHINRVNSASFSPDGKTVLTASDDRTAKLWDAATCRELGTLTGHTGWVNSACFSPDGKTVVTSSYDKTAKLWDAATGRLIGTLNGHSDYVYSACFSSNGKTIITASRDRTAKLWDAATGRELGTLTGHTEWVNSACFSPDGNMVVTASGDKTAKLWDAATCRELGTLTGHTWSSIESASFSPDGKTVVTTSYDGTAKLWDVATCREIGTLTGHIGWVNSACFSPDGKMIVTASGDKTAKLWDAATGTERGTLTGHKGFVESASFSPDGKTVITSSNDNTAKLWDAATCREIGTLAGHTGSVLFACFSPDGRTVVTASADGTVKLWDAKTLECIHTIRNVSGLMIAGCDLRRIHPDSRFSEAEKDLLRQYGALIY